MANSILGSKKTLNIVKSLLKSQPSCGIIRRTADYFLLPSYTRAIRTKGGFTLSSKVLSLIDESARRADSLSKMADFTSFARSKFVKYAPSKLVKQIKHATLLDGVNAPLGAVYTCPNLRPNRITVRFRA
jgi:hypothetical protein